jgi:hypothetical protein
LKNGGNTHNSDADYGWERLSKGPIIRIHGSVVRWY